MENAEPVLPPPTWSGSFFRGAERRIRRPTRTGRTESAETEVARLHVSEAPISLGPERHSQRGNQRARSGRGTPCNFPLALLLRIIRYANLPVNTPLIRKVITKFTLRWGCSLGRGVRSTRKRRARRELKRGSRKNGPR